MSTADTFLGVTALALAKGTVYRKSMSLDSSADDPSFVRRLRRVTLVVGAASLGFAYLLRDIVDAFALAFGLLMVFLPALIGGLLRDKPEESDARWSAILGLLAVIVAIPFGFKVAYLPGFLVATLTYLARLKSAGSCSSET
jgi:Na+/proline symporter